MLVGYLVLLSKKIMNKEEPKISFEQAVKRILGGVAAISEEFYIDAVNEICELSGRDPDDGSVWEDIEKVLETLPCPID